jgi:cytochrome c oxidase subunit 2
MFDYMPPEASTWASKIDWINNLITDISVFCTLAITGAMLFFAYKYRRRSEDQKTSYITHNATLETVWTVIPTIICMYIFYYGFTFYHEMRTPPTNPIEISVSGKKWLWTFTQPNGKTVPQELVVPVGRPVKLIMKSQDVLHSMFLPAMRVKEDVNALYYTYLWFEPTQTGEFPIFCAEYCGDSHSEMRGTLKVVSEAEYQDYLADRTNGPALAPEEVGKQVYEKYQCATCHSLDGTPRVGPSWKGLWGKNEPVLEDGAEKQIDVDENYIRESILNPAKKVVKGFGPPTAMQSYQGQINDDQINGVIAFLKTLK